MGNGFALLLKVNFERYCKINLSLASQKCKCSLLVAVNTNQTE